MTTAVETGIELSAHGVTVRLDIPESDHIAKIIAETGDWYERPMLDDIYARQPKGVAIDVGACFGTHAAWFAAVCGMSVVALEPNPQAASYTEANVARNNLDVRVIRAAAGNRPGSVTPMPPSIKGNLGSARMRLRSRGDNGGMPMVTIDSLGLDDVGLLKVDVEGMELKVLQGAEQTIRTCKPLIYVEAGKTYDEVAQFLRRLNYRQFGRFNKTATYGFAPSDTIQEPSTLVRPTLSAVIMAHHSRERHIPYLHEKLGDIPVIWDEETGDNIPQRILATGRRALLAYDPNATHHLVVQDDALVCRDLMPALEAAVAAVPENPISLYTGMARPNHKYVEYMVEKAERTGATWLAMEGPWWGPAVVIPTRLIPEMVQYTDSLPSHVTGYDRRMSRFFTAKGIDCYYSVPSLVDHRVGSDNPSLVPGRSSGKARTAFRFIGEDASALDIRWTHDAIRRDSAAPRFVSP